MGPERCRTVIKRFIGKELSGPFYQIFESGEQLVFLHHRGDDEEFSVFATLQRVRACTDAEPIPAPQYEVKRYVFEAFTSETPT